MKTLEPKHAKNDNAVASALKAIAYLTYISGFACAIFYHESEMLSIIFFASGIISGTFILGFSEIISLLDAIKNKSYIELGDSGGSVPKNESSKKDIGEELPDL